jgi:hypothetical protein
MRSLANPATPDLLLNAPNGPDFSGSCETLKLGANASQVKADCRHFPSTLHDFVNLCGGFALWI